MGVLGRVIHYLQKEGLFGEGGGKRKPKGGFDLYEIALDRKSWLPARDYIDDRPPPVAVKDDEVAVTAPRPYRALECMGSSSAVRLTDGFSGGGRE